MKKLVVLLSLVLVVIVFVLPAGAENGSMEKTINYLSIESAYNILDHLQIQRLEYRDGVSTNGAPISWGRWQFASYNNWSTNNTKQDIKSGTILHTGTASGSGSPDEPGIIIQYYRQYRYLNFCEWLLTQYTDWNNK